MSNTVEAQVHISTHNSCAVSPVRAPFGSIQCSDSIKPIVLFNFIEFICSRLKADGISEIALTNPPDIYDPYISSLLNTFLLNLGFLVKKVETGAVLEIKNDFETGLNAWERRRLRQATDAHLKFVLLNSSELEVAYNLILRCRKERKYTFSLDWSTLERTVKAFPDRFILFGVKHQEVLIAASISINVGNGVMYNFHSAHPRKYDNLSPVVLLLQGIRTYCKDNNFRMLDLGTSALSGKPNFKLLDFKLGLGAQPTTKFTFVKNL